MVNFYSYRVIKGGRTPRCTENDPIFKSFFRGNDYHIMIIKTHEKRYVSLLLFANILQKHIDAHCLHELIYNSEFKF